MHCHVCHQELSAAEVLRHEEQERDFEAFERSLYQSDIPDALEDVEIPDRVAPEAPVLTMVDGQVVVPAAWALPECDRCLVLDRLETVLVGHDGREAYPLMCAYADGTHGCPQSPVMAYSWALVLLHWFIDEEDPSADPTYVEAVELTTTLQLRLTAKERYAAMTLANDALMIALDHGALWV